MKHRDLENLRLKDASMWCARVIRLVLIVLGMNALWFDMTPAVAAHGGSVRSGHGAVPPAAGELARRLGITVRPIVGDQPAGQGAPWVAWFTRAINPGWIGPANVPNHYLALDGPTLLSGPLGARGEFHYYNPGPIRTSDGDDHYRGVPISRARGLTIAYRWLRAIGAPAPRGSPHVLLRPGMTDLGGTGLCCYRSLAVFSWGGQSDQFGNVHDARDVIYVADAGTVVEADLGPLLTGSGYGFSRPCPGQTRTDANGIALGGWCFDYASAVRSMIIGTIGGHSSWIDDPGQVGWLASLQRGIELARIGPRRRVLLRSNEAIYEQAYRGVRYETTLVPAFPGLPGSIWELVRVQREMAGYQRTAQL